MPSNGRAVVAETCFWIAAFDSGEQHHKQAAALLEDLRQSILLMPWPIMYEVLRTRTVRQPKMVRAFSLAIRQPRVMKIDDTIYRDLCLEETIDQASKGRRGISLVDNIVRAVLSDEQFRITRLLTFNRADFVDVCEKRRIAMVPNI